MTLSHSKKMAKVLAVSALTAVMSVSASAAVDCTAIPVWNAQDVYTGSKQAQEDNKVYKANWYSQGHAPSAYSGPWQEWSFVDDCITGPQENKKPTASISAPSQNAKVIVGSNIAVSVNANDEDGTVTNVEFFLDGVSVATDSSAPYTHTINSPEIGSHNIQAIATDNEGAKSTAASVDVTVEADIGTAPPQVSLTSPANGTTVTEGDVVTITADASDDSAVAKVEFFVDGALLSSDNTAPYSASYSSVEGAHAITATATDDMGLSTTTSATNITVEKKIVTPGGTCDAPQYIAGTDYQAGTQVQNVEGLFECEIYGWCGAAAWAYEPGVGTNWDDAWNQIGVCLPVEVTATFASPAAGSAYLAGSSVTVSATASTSGDAPSKVESIELFLNGQTQGVVSADSINQSVMLSQLGDNEIRIDATDSEGYVGTSSVTVVVSDKEVVTQITSFSNNDTVKTGKALNITATAEGILNPIANVEFFVGAQSIGVDSTAPYTATYTAATDGVFNLTSTATDTQGNKASDTIALNAVTNTLNDRIVVGYWHNFDNGSGFIRLPEVSTQWDVVNVSFAEPIQGSDSYMQLEIQTKLGHTEAQMIQDIKDVQARGQKVLISIGGANAHVVLKTESERQEFVDTMTALIQKYGFDGFDIDLEGGSTLALDAGDTDFRNPTTKAHINMISASKEIIANFGGDLMLTMAPETLYVQGGISGYGPLQGAYLPIIHGLRDELTFIHVQHYNTGGMDTLNGSVVSPGTADFHVAMTEPLLAGFPIARNSQNIFPALREDQVAFGVPSMSAAGGNFTSVQEVQKAITYIVTGEGFGGSYELVNPEGYNGFRGLMTWSINWDRTNGNEFINSHAPFLDSLPAVQ